MACIRGTDRRGGITVSIPLNCGELLAFPTYARYNDRSYTVIKFEGKRKGMGEQEEKEVMELALQAGHLLLENGAEIFRVEETMDRICKHYGVRSGSAFVLSNGIFATAGSERERYFAKVQHIPVSGTHLNRVAAVNQLSREIESGQYTVEAAAQALEDIKNMPGKRKSTQVLASGVLCAGLVLYLYVLYVSAPRLSKIVGNIGGGALVTFICSGFYLLGAGAHLNFMIIGSIMPLIPGVAFTNAIRDIADGDYISGSVRVFFSIAIGVGMAFSFISRVTGGALL